MKTVLAFDSYKGCLSSSEVAASAADAVRAVYPDSEIVELPVADGGEGTVEALASVMGGRIVTAEVSDPLGRPVTAGYGIAGNVAIIEVSAACGLTLLSPSERNPLAATTRGVGEMILDAVARGCKRFLIGLGGSATVDGGRGMIETPGFIEKTRGLKFTVACDVSTSFIGPQGASRVFAPQKGASAAEVELLESRLCEYASEIELFTGVDVRNMPGAGAAGGLGGAFHAYLGAELVPGIDMVLDALDFDSIIGDADLVITGEGCSDCQTAKGKTPCGVLRRASRHGIKVALVSGEIRDRDELSLLGFTHMIAATPRGMELQDALRPEVAAENVRKAVLELLKY